MKALCNANFNKIQITSVTDKELQIQKLNSVLEKEQYEENNGKRQQRIESIKSDSTTMWESENAMKKIWKQFAKVKRHWRTWTKNKMGKLKD